jgi:hypothetical protein
MFPGETVLSGAPHPGTELQVLSSGAGYYIGYLCKDGMPYSRESDYFPDEQSCQAALDQLKTAIADPTADRQSLDFLRS